MGRQNNHKVPQMNIFHVASEGVINLIISYQILLNRHWLWSLRRETSTFSPRTESTPSQRCSGRKDFITPDLDSALGTGLFYPSFQNIPKTPEFWSSWILFFICIYVISMQVAEGYTLGTIFLTELRIRIGLNADPGLSPEPFFAITVGSKILHFFSPFFHSALQRKSHMCISFLGIARPQPQIQHSCVCERFV